MSSRKQSFIKGAFILALGGISVKFIGAIFRIVLAAIIDDEGIGLYQMAYPIYTTLLTISTAGIPIAISKIIAAELAYNNYHGARQVFRIALMILATTGLVISLMLFLGANFLVEFVVKDPRAYFPLIAVAPAIFIVTIMSSFRGFFQGQQMMVPTAVSQIVEQVGRVVVALTLVYLLLPYGLEYAAAGAAFGAVGGASLALLFLLTLYIKQRSRFVSNIGKKNGEDKSTVAIIIDIAKLAIPITLGNLVLPLMNIIDLVVVPMRLHVAGFDVNRATALYGQLTGMANPILHIPTIITISLAISLVPAISEAFSLRDNRQIRVRSSLAVRLTLLLGLPSAMGLYILAVPISEMLFNNPEVGIPLAIMAIGVIFVTLQQTTSGILQGLGKTMIPVIALGVGASLKFILSWFITALPQFNIQGAAFATVIGFLVAALINLKKVRDFTGMVLDFKKAIIKPLLSVVFMGIGVYFSYNILAAYFTDSTLALSLNPISTFEHFKTLYEVGNNNFSFVFSKANALATILSIFIGMVLYVFALFVSGSLDREDLLLIPKIGHGIAKIASTLRLIK